MPLPQPFPGLVIRYGYIWRHQSRAGYESGLKNRPCVVVLATEKQNNEVVVTVAPITHRSPDSESTAIEIPRVVKERLGLDDETSWVVITEVNRFIWPGHDIVPTHETPPLRYDYGVLPPLLFRKIRDALYRRWQASKIAITPRD